MDCNQCNLENPQLILANCSGYLVYLSRLHCILETLFSSGSGFDKVGEKYFHQKLIIAPIAA